MHYIHRDKQGVLQQMNILPYLIWIETYIQKNAVQ